MFLLIVCSCTTICSDKFGQAIVDTVKFLLPIATRNLPTSVNINLNASVKKISAIGCARHQIDQSIKFSQSFCGVNDNIVCDLSGYALFASLDCMVRDRLSKKASTSSTTGISNAIAAFSKVSRLGVRNPVNHRDQLVNLTPVRASSSLYESSKKYSLFFVFKAYIEATIISCVYQLVNSGNVNHYVNITQTIKHPLKQVLYRNQDSRKDGKKYSNTYDYHSRPKGRLPSPNFSMHPFGAEMGGVA